MPDTADARPFPDRRFARCVIRQVGTEAERQADWERLIEILAAIRRRMAKAPSVGRSEDSR